MAKMSTLEILQKSMANSGKDPQRIHDAMAHLVNTNPKFRVMRSGNTLFSYYNNGDKTADVAMDTAATPRELVNDIKQFTSAMKVAGFKAYKFKIDNPQITKIFKMLNINYKVQPMQNGLTMGLVEV